MQCRVASKYSALTNEKYVRCVLYSDQCVRRTRSMSLRTLYAQYVPEYIIRRTSYVQYVRRTLYAQYVPEYIVLVVCTCVHCKPYIIRVVCTCVHCTGGMYLRTLYAQYVPEYIVLVVCSVTSKQQLVYTVYAVYCIKLTCTPYTVRRTMIIRQSVLSR